MDQPNFSTEHCEEGFVIWFRTLLNISVNDFYYFVWKQTELSVISHIFLQYQHLGLFCCIESPLFVVVLVSSVMRPLFSERL